MDEDDCATDKQKQPDGVYLELLSDETEETCQGPEPPLPRPRPESKPQSQDREYEGLKDEKPEHLYLHVVRDETQGCDRRTKAEDQVQNVEAEDRDTNAPDRDQEHGTKPQD